MTCWPFLLHLGRELFLQTNGDSPPWDMHNFFGGILKKEECKTIYLKPKNSLCHPSKFALLPFLFVQYSTVSSHFQRQRGKLKLMVFMLTFISTHLWCIYCHGSGEKENEARLTTFPFLLTAISTSNTKVKRPNWCVATVLGQKWISALRILYVYPLSCLSFCQ